MSWRSPVDVGVAAQIVVDIKTLRAALEDPSRLGLSTELWNDLKSVSDVEARFAGRFPDL